MARIRVTYLIVLGTILSSGCAQTMTSTKNVRRSHTFSAHQRNQGNEAAAVAKSKATHTVKQTSYEPKDPEELPSVVQVVRGPDEHLACLEQAAIANNPTLAEAHAKVRAARGRWVQVGLPANPVVGYSGQQLGSGGTAEQHGLLIGQELIHHQKRSLNRAVADREFRSAQQQWAAQHQRVLTDVRIAYYTLLAAQQQVDLATEIAEISKKAAKITGDLFDSGDVAKSAKMQSRVDAETAQIRMENSHNEQRAAWRNLMAVVGTPDQPLQRIAAQLSNQVPDLTWLDVRDRLWCHSPEMATALIEMERARRAVDRARVEKRPNVELEGVLQVDHSTNSINTNVLAKIPLPVFDRNQGGVREATAQLRAAKAAIECVELRLQQRLSEVFQRYQNARNQVERFTRAEGILESTEAALASVNALYASSDVSFLEQQAAQRAYIQTNLTYIAALRELWTAVAEMDGLLLRDSLEK